MESYANLIYFLWYNRHNSINSILQLSLVFLTLEQEEGEDCRVPEVHESVLDGPSLRARVERVVGVTDAGGDGELENFKVLCFAALSSFVRSV